MVMKAREGSSIHNVRLIGGRRDGTYYCMEHPRGYWPKHLWLMMPLTIDEAKELAVDDSILYRWPDEGYRLDEVSLGHQYVYEKTVHYDPRRVDENV